MNNIYLHLNVQLWEKIRTSYESLCFFFIYLDISPQQKKLKSAFCTVRQIVYKCRTSKATTNMAQVWLPKQVHPGNRLQVAKSITGPTAGSCYWCDIILARCARRKPLLSNKNTKARLKFVREQVDKDQNFWNNVLWKDESKM